MSAEILRRAARINGAPLPDQARVQGTIRAGELRAAADRMDALEAALRPLADKHLFPDDLGEEFASEKRAEDDWDEAQNDEVHDDCWIARGWIKAARALIGGPKQ